MTRQQRLDAVHAAIRNLARHPEPATISDGLSGPMATACLRCACDLLDPGSLAQATDVPGRAPPLAAVVAARGVFTAPLEWVALLAAAGSEVVLKVPAAAPCFGEAVARAFVEQGLPVGSTTAHQLPVVDALVAMGSDQTIATLAAQHAHARLSLHGHRFSVAVVAGTARTLAEQLAIDALLYDGRGCFTPVAVLHLGVTEEVEHFTAVLAEELATVAERLPAGAQDPLLGPEWRRRTGLARALGGLVRDAPPTTALLPPTQLEVAALPGYLPVHPLQSLEQAAELLAPWRPWLAACATDLDDPARLFELGFERVCPPGTLQKPPIPRRHGGREMLHPLMIQPSKEGAQR